MNILDLITLLREVDADTEIESFYYTTKENIHILDGGTIIKAHTTRSGRVQVGNLDQNLPKGTNQ